MGSNQHLSARARIWLWLPVLAICTLVLWHCSDKPTELHKITPVNHAPEFVAVSSQNVMVGDTLEFDVSATDADGDSLALSCTNPPPNSEFVDSGNDSASFTFAPADSQIAVFQISFVASDGELADTMQVQVTVLAQPNRAPVLSVIDTATVMEGDSLRLSVSATDPDGTIPDIEVLDLPANAVFTADEGSGEFMIVPDSLQVGTLEVAFVASDGDLSDTAVVSITVIERPNWAPVLNIFGETEVLQGSTLELLLSTTDQDGDSLSLSAENVPQNAIFTDRGDGTGHFVFTPDYIQLGFYEVTFIASDGVFDDTVVVSIEVLDAPNQAPVIEHIGQQYVFVGGTLNVDVAVTDVDGTALTFEILELPLNSTWIYSGVDFGTFSFAPDTFQVGEHTVGLAASDGELADTLSFGVTVLLDTMAFFQDGPIPCAVGNYWVYEYTWCHMWGGGQGQNCSSDTFTYQITGIELSVDKVWWQLNLPWPSIGDSFSMSGDTLFQPNGNYFVFRAGESGITDGCWEWAVYEVDAAACDRFQEHEDRDCIELFTGCDNFVETIDPRRAALSYGNGFASFRWWGPSGNTSTWTTRYLIEYDIREE
jgi:hypothetical protein